MKNIAPTWAMEHGNARPLSPMNWTVKPKAQMVCLSRLGVIFVLRRLSSHTVVVKLTLIFGISGQLAIPFK